MKEIEKVKHTSTQAQTTQVLLLKLKCNKNHGEKIIHQVYLPLIKQPYSLLANIKLTLEEKKNPQELICSNTLLHSIQNFSPQELISSSLSLLFR
jgi:hypothetical protein